MNLDDVENLFEAGPKGVEEWNSKRVAGETIPDLGEVIVCELELSGVDFSGLRLVGACFCNANLDNANFHGANLRGADLSSVQARHACFIEADLRDSRFGVWSLGLGHSGPNADISGADFTRARLARARLDGTYVRDACFDHADLTGVDLPDTNLSLAKATNAKR